MSLKMFRYHLVIHFHIRRHYINTGAACNSVAPLLLYLGNKFAFLNIPRSYSRAENCTVQISIQEIAVMRKYKFI